MAQKIISQLDSDGYFIGEAIADESPLEPGVYHIPAGAIDRSPPASVEAGKRYRTWGNGWRGEAVPAPEVPPEVPQMTAAEKRRQEIEMQLFGFDMQSIRALRVALIEQGNGRAVPAFEKAKLSEIEASAAALRAELAGLA